MELRQLRYFVRVVEQGSMSRAALDLDVVQSALSQQITRLESELSTRLLQRTPRGVTPTEAGLAFFREAQLTLRHADQAARVARQARLSGTVTVGLAPTTASVLDQDEADWDSVIDVNWPSENAATNSRSSEVATVLMPASSEQMT